MPIGIYALVFGALTLADYLTTQAGIASGGARELNSVVKDGAGGLSARYFALNAAVGVFALWLFASGWPRLTALSARKMDDSTRIMPRQGYATAVQTGLHRVHYAMVVLGMKIIAVISNTMVPLGLITFPGLILRASGGMLPDWAVLILMITLSFSVSVIMMLPVTRALVPLARRASDG